MVGFIILFIVIFIVVLAFKKDKSVTTVTRRDENGNEIRETQVTEYHSAGRTAARIVLGLFLAGIVLVMLVFCAASF